MLRHVLIVLTATLASSLWVGSAIATVPPEVLKAYQAYSDAMKRGDVSAATRHAKAAHEAGEKLIGMDPQTGVLAHNYAELLFSTDPEAAIKYFKRAIELTPNNTPENRELNAERYIRVGQSWLRMPDLYAVNVRRLKGDFSEIHDFMVEHDLVESTFGAEALVLSAVRQYLNADLDEALSDVDRALEIFESPAHTIVSPLRYEAHILKGDILKNNSKPIEAALSYQIVMQNLEGDVPAEHPFINTAFHRWMSARGIIALENLTEQAIDAGVCKCWPYDEMSAKAPLPKFRVPPRIPSRARRSGHVMVVVDVDRDGEPYNIRARGATDKLFVNPALRTVKRWEYEVSDELEDEDLKGIVTKIIFNLLDERGRLIPSGELEMFEDEG